MCIYIYIYIIIYIYIYVYAYIYIYIYIYIYNLQYIERHTKLYTNNIYTKGYIHKIYILLCIYCLYI